MKRVVAAVLLVIVAAHLLLLYMNFSFRYSATIGVEQAVHENRVSGNWSLLFLALTVSLQFLIAWLVKPRRIPQLEVDRFLKMKLPESSRPELNERYVVLLAASAVSTLVLFAFLLFVAARTGYHVALLRFLGLA